MTSSQYPLMAPLTRASIDDIRLQHERVAGADEVRQALEVFPLVAFVIDQHRQIVYGNSAAAALLHAEFGDAIGRRFGEVVRCRHSDETPGGCGTTEFCTACGAAKALLASSQGASVCEECRIISKSLGADLNLRVWARPLDVAGETFTLFTLLDIRDEKRREALERIFFHDVMNTAGGIQGIAMLVGDAPDDEREDLVAALERLSSQLIDELESQRDLIPMEQGDLVVRAEPLSSRGLLGDVVNRYLRHDLAIRRTVRLDPGCADVRFESDPRLLRRVVGNMTKNALEACPAGGTVTLACDGDAERVRIRVHNPGVIPADVQLQLFQRSFSTKAPGRGLGTYSMKLLSERYLDGRVSFTSADEAGTTFIADYPRHLRGTNDRDGSDLAPR